ncbi:MAG TPA: DinB family protein, partial [Myxococcales bacterium]
MDVFERLSRTPALLARVAAQMPDALVRLRSGPFALVEHAWHIADLEREGFGERVRRLIAEEDPFLPDFDGERIAREREYLKLELAPAVAAFAAAREQTLRSLRAVSRGQLARSGRQEGVGTITL